MYKVTKDGRKAKLISDVQLAAYQNSGWMLDGELTPLNHDEPDPEREEWMERAKSAGIKPHWNIGIEKLMAQVLEAETGKG